MINKRIQKLILIPLLILVLIGPILAPFAEGVSFSFPEKYDMVAILVEQGLYANETDYAGLSESVSGPEIRSTTLKSRVDRYAVDVQNALPGTRAAIIQVDRFEKPENIAAVIERLYFDGDPAEPNRTAYLRGVIIIGEVPLPVVNKNSNRFISLFPYTDFESPVYIWNPATSDFELSAENANPQAEIWHGVIRPPVSTQTDEGRRSLAEYFDKNHLYHIPADSPYKNFSKKIFFQDFVEEKKNLNPIAYRNYLKFLEHQDDIAYFRYTRQLFQDLSGSTTQEMAALEADAQSAAAALAASGIPMDRTIPQPELPADAPPAGSLPPDAEGVPDIMTKIGRMSDNLMYRFNQVFTRFPNELNDFIRYTGRYVTQTPDRFSLDVDSPVNLITAKDNFTMGYLKAVNTMVENKIDEVVGAIQKPIRLPLEATISIIRAVHKPMPGTSNPFEVTLSSPFISNTPVAFTNFSPELKMSLPTVPFPPGIPYIPPGTEMTPALTVLSPSTPVVLGTPFSQVTSVSQCTLYRGSRGTGSYSKLVEANHAFNLNSANEADNTYATGTTTAEGQAICERANDAGLNAPAPNEENCVGFTLHGGCFYVAPGQSEMHSYNYDDPNQRWCFPERALMPVFDSEGTRERNSAPAGFDDYRACFNFNEKDQWQKHLNATELYLRALDNGDYNFDRRFGDDIAQYRTPDVLNSTRNPQEIILLESRGEDEYTVKLSDVLSGLPNFMQGADFQNTLNLFLAAAGTTTVVTIGASHPKLESVTVQVGRETDRELSSVFYHKEPTTETISAQARNMLSQDLPVDSPRYVTFKSFDDASPPIKIEYPDIFAEPSLDSYLNKLRGIENRLNTIRRSPESVSLPCGNCLTALVANGQEMSSAAGSDARIMRASREKVLDAINWENMDIDSKHKYLSEYYLDPSKNAYIGESLNGYEFAYFNGEGLADGYRFALTPQPEETDAAFSQGARGPAELPEPFEDDPENPFDEAPEDSSGQEGYDLFSWSPPPISPWWEKMKEWASDLGETLSSFSFGDSQNSVSGRLDEENRAALENLRNENDAINANPANADQLDLERIASISLEDDSNVVAAGKNMGIRISLRDAAGAIVNDEFAQLNLIINQSEIAGTSTSGTSSASTPIAGDSTQTSGANAALFSSDIVDENAAEPGHQITLMSGRKTVGLIAPEIDTRLKVRAQLSGGGPQAELNLTVSRGAKLVLESQTRGVVANGTNALAINISAQDGQNQPIANFNGTVRLSVSDSLMGRIAQEEVRLQNGRGTVNFVSGRKKGTLFIRASSPALDPGQIELNMLPGPPVRIGLSAQSEFLPVIAGESLPIQATIFDANNNAVDTNSAALINFRLTSQSGRFASLSSAAETVSNGVAAVNLSPTNQTGDVNVVAESPGLSPGAITIKAVRKFGSQELSGMQPDALAVSLLGIPAGNVSEQNFLGGRFLMNGRTQVLNSLTSQPKPSKKLFEVNSNGGLRITDASRYSASFVPANNFTLAIRDNQLQIDVAKLTIFTLRNGQFAITEAASPAQLGDGIYIKKTAQDSAYEVDMTVGALRVAKHGSEKFEIQTNGYARIFDNDFSIRPKNGIFLTLEILDSGTPVAEVYFVQHFNQDVFVQQMVTQAPGVYLQPARSPPNIAYERAFSGSSSADPAGVAFYDKNIPSEDGAPGFSFQSLEDSLDRFGVGFTLDNKFALLFSAGETFGEANKLYASDAGIVLGDPTVRLPESASGANFSKDVGKLIYSGGDELNGLLNLDFNGDGFDDIFAIEGEGKVRLIQNNGGADQLRDQGYILNIKNGIEDWTRADFNNDGLQDLVIAAKESCRRGETCIDIYENQQGAFERRNLRFEQQEKVVTIESQDLNRDNYPEIILADAAGDIKILYNRQGQFDSNARLIGNVGLQVNPSENLITNVLLRYSGMPERNPEDPVSNSQYQTLSLREANPGADQGFSNFFPAGLRNPPMQETGERLADRDFIYADLDTAFPNSTKFAQDLNGGILRGGDRVRYTITLSNTAASAKENVMISDVVSDQVDLDSSSIRCSDCSANEFSTAPLSGDSARPSAFKITRIPGRSARRIVYETVFRGDSETSDKINIIFNDRFSDSNAILQASLRQDSYPDLGVTKEGNPTGQLLYYYTTGVDSDGTLTFGTQLSSPSAPVTAEQIQAQTGLNIPSASDFSDFTVHCSVPAPIPGNPLQRIDVDDVTTEGCVARNGIVGDPSGPPASVRNQLAGMRENDSDGDGLQDVIDDINGALDSAADATSAAVSKLTCNAGCIPMPVNMAFLSPGFFSVLGMPAAFDIGLPVFGWGAPSIIPTYPPMPPLSTLGGRFYISPTLTGGVGFAVCLGAFGTPRNCFSFGVNPLDLIAPGACDSISGAINGALSAVNNAISNLNEGMTLSLGHGGSSVGTGGRHASGSGFGSYSLGSYRSPVSRSRNIRIPGFLNIISEWASRQLEEVTKVLALPDIYIIYPSWSSMKGAVAPVEKFSWGSLLSWVNSIPLVEIETQDVTFNVPTFTRKEIERFKADARQWIEDEQAELDKFKNLFKCFNRETGFDMERCRIIQVGMEGMINSVAANMRALDEWILFPKKLAQFRSIEAYYLGQIIDYIDTIIQWTGGWVKKNTARVKQWRSSIRNIREILRSWRLLFQLMIDYNQSCDKCKTERYSLKDLILRIFIAIPSPPIIPLPKLPDFIIDVSKIQGGLKIQWPNVKFKPVTVTLPKLPRISIPVDLSIPLFELNLPSIPVIPSPPDLPNLPALPPLPLPKLPDVPPPPTMPGLPGPITAILEFLKKLLKILCIIRLGFIPTDEILLKTRIEEITARPLSPLLPIDLLLTIESPSITISYVDQLIITAFTNLQLDLRFIQQLVEAVAHASNKKVGDIVNKANSLTNDLSRAAERFTTPDLNLNLDGSALNRRLNFNDEKELSKMLSESFGFDATEITHYGLRVRDALDELNETKKENEKLIASTPQYFMLQMEEEIWKPGMKPVVADSDIVTPFQERLKSYRDRLAERVKDSSRFSDSVALDLADFSRYVASQKSPFIASSFKKYLAATDDVLYKTDAGFGSGKLEPVKVGQIDIENVEWLEDETEESAEAVLNEKLEKELKGDLDRDPDLEKLIASTYTMPEPPAPVPPSMQSALGESSGGGISAGAQNVGLFFVDTNGQSQRLINYTLEAQSKSFLADIDVDRDGDSDKLYSYGNNLFLKKNRRIAEEAAAPVFRQDDLEFWTVFELLPRGRSPIFPKVLSETSRSASFSFGKPVMNDIAGYEIVAKNSPLFFENRLPVRTLRTHLVPESGDARAGTTSSVLPEPQPIYAKIGAVSGSANFLGRKRDYVQASSGTVHVNSGEVLHARTNGANILWSQNGSQETEMSLQNDKFLSVPTSLAGGLDVRVESGVLEIVRTEENTQPVAAGMAIFFDDEVFVNSGEITVSYARGGDTALNENEKYALKKIDSVDDPLVNLDLDPAFYFAKIYAFDSQGRRSVSSEKLLLSPQICDDASAPIANFGGVQFRVAIGKTLQLDASRSFDAEGRVISYWLDIDVGVDSDGDGSANNDKDLKTDLDPQSDSDGDLNSANDQDSPYFTVGPYSEPSQKQMRLTVRDEALNEGFQDITIEVITPTIVLDADALSSNIITGRLDPPEANVPITIARLRPGTSSQGWDLLHTPSADPGGQYYTNPDGIFTISDADFRERLVVRNAEGVIVAEINTTTGRITITGDRYETRLAPSSPPNLPMRIGIFLKTDPPAGNPLTFVYFVPDVNTDVIIDGPSVAYTAQSARVMSGVHIKPLPEAGELGMGFRILPGTDEELPGAAVLERNGLRLAVIDVDGDIAPLDSGILTLAKPVSGSSALADEPVIFEMNFEREPIAEIFISANSAEERVEIIDEPRMPTRPRLSRPRQPFSDVNNSDAFSATVENLYRRGVIAGYPSAGGGLEFRPGNPINRAEFTQITLNMLCIVPRPEARSLPSPFYDVLDTNLWFYPALKEGNIRGFIRGYLGESRHESSTGQTQTPFKPANQITWAEASTVVLAALYEEGVIDLSTVDLAPDSGEPWYQKYLAIGQNLEPFLRDQSSGGRYLITAEEALRANEPITRRDFAVMAERVLLISDCESSAMAPNEDLDGDGLANGVERELGTNPQNPDTDRGGVSDFDEVQRGTNPADNPADDRLTSPSLERTEEGIYVLRPACGDVCPCRASIGQGADLQPGDLLFAAITGSGGLPIYVKSNEETY